MASPRCKKSPLPDGQHLWDVSRRTTRCTQCRRPVLPWHQRLDTWLSVHWMAYCRFQVWLDNHRRARKAAHNA